MKAKIAKAGCMPRNNTDRWGPRWYTGQSREAGKMPHKKQGEGEVGERGGKLKGAGHTAKLAAHQTRSRQACKWYKFNLIKLLKSQRANCANALCPGELKIAEVPEREWRRARCGAGIQEIRVKIPSNYFTQSGQSCCRARLRLRQ